MRPWVFGAALSGIQLFVVPAGAFCRSTTCDPRYERCEVVDACVVSGAPLKWERACVSFGIQRDGSPLRGIDYETTRQHISAAFDRWMQADCGGGRTPSIAFAPNDEPIECAEVRYNPDAPNANVWLFRDDEWPYEPPPGQETSKTLALTTTTFVVSTGELYDADVEFNSHERAFTASSAAAGVDLAAVATHEAGHFLGLADTKLATATMRGDYHAAMASLDSDDMDGICTIYPPDAPLGTCDFTPRHGFSPECYAEEGCCTVAPGRRREPRNGELALAAICVALLVYARRRSVRIEA